MMKPGFSVLRFGLEQSFDGRLVQDVRRCGEFPDVEQAFDAARVEVLYEWQALVNRPRYTNQARHAAKLKITDTEWGYELKEAEEVIARYWVHDASPAEIPGAGALPE